MKLDDDYYAIINASLEPLNSTIKILAGQLIYVTIIVFVLSFLIAYFVSKYISKPIVNLTKTAKEMAKGNHDIEFKTTGEIKEIDSLADTLNTANKELEHTDLLRRELMANVSHDLKTPLTMIKAYAEMVRDLTFDNKEKRNSNLNTIIDETDRLNLLVNDMLELSKMQSNVIELNLEKFDLNETIETVVNRFSYLEELDKYKFEYKGIKKAYILADKKKIEQVIYNLISNATNYVGEDKKVIVKLQEFEDVYHVEVIDHGKGIDKEDLNLIWDKYYRVDKKHKRNTIGTGLGLSIVKNIFIMHNIDYGVFSKKGKGTTFYFNVKKED
jgi:signal transduction histidine kinase